MSRKAVDVVTMSGWMGALRAWEKLTYLDSFSVWACADVTLDRQTGGGRLEQQVCLEKTNVNRQLHGCSMFERTSCLYCTYDSTTKPTICLLNYQVFQKKTGREGSRGFHSLLQSSMWSFLSVYPCSVGCDNNSECSFFSCLSLQARTIYDFSGSSRSVLKWSCFSQL